MRGQVSWISAGVIELSQRSGEPLTHTAEDLRLEAGDVRLVMGELGTELKWKVQSPCYASLFRAVQFLDEARPPFILRFHAYGWFEEVYRDRGAASRRIEEILARGDRQFFSRAFVQEVDPRLVPLSPVLRHALEKRDAQDDFSVEATLDQLTHNYVVERVGPKSAIGRVWGTITSSFPCQPISKYGDAVSEAYDRVLQSGEPHYDQVLAALRLPDNQVHWVPYHRVILPKYRERGSPAVTVVSEIARVDIKVL